MFIYRHFWKESWMRKETHDWNSSPPFPICKALSWDPEWSKQKQPQPPSEEVQAILREYPANKGENIEK